MDTGPSFNTLTLQVTLLESLIKLYISGSVEVTAQDSPSHLSTPYQSQFCSSSIPGKFNS